MKNEFKEIEGYVCATCGQEYKHIPNICDCGQISCLGNFKPVYVVPLDDRGWECININLFDYPAYAIKNATRGTYSEEYGDPNLKKIWVSSDFNGVILVKHRNDLSQWIKVF
jgi:hypothetical protein